MKFVRMNQAGTFGYEASVGDRSVEVLRSFPGDWYVFAKIDKSVCKAWDGSHGNYNECPSDS